MRSNRLLAALASLVALAWGCGGTSQPEPEAPVVAEPTTDEQPTTVEPEKAPEPKGPFLYVAQGRTGPVYLLGTIHMSVSAKEDLDPVVWEKFTSAKKLVLELDPTKANPLEMMARAVSKEGPPLSEQLGEARWTKLTTLVDAVPAAMLDKMKPWAAQMLLSLTGIDATKSMELEMVTHANEHEMPIGALETMEDQLAALEKTSDIEALKEAIDDHDKNQESLAKLIETYRSGDLDAFIEVFDADMTDPAQTDALLKDRNEKWVPQIEAMLEGGNIFVAVGAGHLYGEHGLLPLLAERGHEFERVPPSEQSEPAESSPVDAESVEGASGGVDRPGLQRAAVQLRIDEVGDLF